MAMGAAASSAYLLSLTGDVLKAAEKVICDEYRDLAGFDANESFDIDEALQELANEHQCIWLPIGREEIQAEIYFYDRDSGDRYDGLEEGFYLMFTEDDLYSRKKTVLGNLIEKHFSFPEFKQWTVFG